jgi:hypothetical protein
MARLLSYAFVFGAAALVASCAAGDDSNTQTTSLELSAPGVKLVFNEQGQAGLPKGYRHWVHTYTAWEAISESFLSEKVTKTPELHSVYVEPNAYRTFMKTGKWPEGSLIVKEFSTTNTDPKDCSGPPAYTCKLGTSTIIFAQEHTGIAVMLKDNKRYPKEPGGWAYFSFGHQAPPYQKLSAAHDRGRCAQCHIGNVGPKDDYVWSSKRNQPGFRRICDNVKLNLEAALAE